MPAKRTTLPPELMEEWADERAVRAVQVGDKSCEWKCLSGHPNYKQRINDRLRGKGCPLCGHVKKGANNPRRGLFRKHPDFPNIQQYVSSSAVVSDAISPPCQTCGKPYVVTISDWLYGGYRQEASCAKNWGNFRKHPDFVKIEHMVPVDCLNGGYKICPPCEVCGNPQEVTIRDWVVEGYRRHHSCAKPKRLDYQIPTGVVCLEPERLPLVDSNVKLRWRCPAGHSFYTGKALLDRAALSNTISKGCSSCAPNSPIIDRLAAEAPDLLRNLNDGNISDDGAVALLWRYGKKGVELKSLLAGLYARQEGKSVDEQVQATLRRAEELKGIEGTEGADGDDAELLPPQLDDDQAPTPNQRPAQVHRPDDADKFIHAIEALDRNNPTDESDIKDVAAYKHLVASIIRRWWLVYDDLEMQPSRHQQTLAGHLASIAAASSSPSKLLNTAAAEFQRQHNGAVSLKWPSRFKPHKRVNGKYVAVEPTTHQRLTAFLMVERNRLLNASAPGAGKTLAAMLVDVLTRRRNSLALIICPLSVIPRWEEEIQSCYTRCPTSGFTEQKTWTPKDDTEFLLINYDMLGQDLDAVAKFLDVYAQRIHLVILDECHRIKNDGEIDQGDESARRAAVNEIRERTASAKWLIQTGTPTLTGVAEGVSLLRLLDPGAVALYELGKPRNCIEHAMMLHFAFAQYGIRFKPDFGVSIVQPVIEWLAEPNRGDWVAAYKRGQWRRCHLHNVVEYEVPTEVGDEVKRMRRKSWLRVDERLLDYRLAAIEKHIKSQTVIYTHAVGKAEQDAEVVDRVCAWLKKLGISHAAYTGRAAMMKPLRSKPPGWNDVVPYRVRDKALDDYKAKKVDVLVCSAPLGEGVTGLHEVGHRVIILSPPWTDGAYQQLVGRWLRMGQKKTVEVIMPFVWWRGSDDLKYSLDLDRFVTIQTRSAIAEAVLDGRLPRDLAAPMKLRDVVKMHLEKGGA